MKLSFKLLSRNTKKGQPVVVFIRDSKNKKEYATSWYCKKTNWNYKKSRVKPKTADADNINRILDEIEANWNALKLKNGAFSSVDVAFNLLFNSDASGDGIIKEGIRKYFENNIKPFLATEGNKKIYDTSIRSLEKFYEKVSRKPITFGDVNKLLLIKFVKYLAKGGASGTTANQYLRTLRSIFNKVEDQSDFSFDAKLFRKVIPKTDSTPPVALNIDEINRLKNLELSKTVGQEKARDLFLLSIYMRGIDIGDLILMRRINYDGSRYVFKRLKLGDSSKELNIKIVPEAKFIIDKYKLSGNTTYLFFKISHPNTSAADYKIFENKRNSILRACNRMSANYNFDSLKFKVARHSFSIIANDLGIEMSIIGEMLGHTREQYKSIDVLFTYLRDSSQAKIDKAHEKVIFAITQSSV